MLEFITGPVEALFASTPFQSPSWFLIVPLAMIILYVLLRTDLVRVTLDNIQQRRRRRLRAYVFFSRTIIVLLLAAALATPYVEVTQEASGNPEITMLVDESQSMQVMDTSITQGLADALAARVPTTVREIGGGVEDRLGNDILDNLESDSHILLVSDGRVANGASLEEVAFFANNNLNASISAISLEPQERDASVYITGPSTVVADTTNEFSVRITKTHDDPVPLTITIDGQTIFDEPTNEESITFEREFDVGDVQLEARIASQDRFPDNNQFYKTVRSLEKPRILLVSNKQSPVEGILDELYAVDKRGSIPQDLSDYYAIVTNDVEESDFTNTEAIHDFLIDEEGGYFGGGLVTIGGFNSFDRGGYANSPIESMLPVTVGAGDQKKGDDNIVILMHISSATTGERYEQQCENGNCRFVQVTDDQSVLDIIKAQAINLISSERNIIASNKVGVIAFGADATTDIPGTFERSDNVRVVEELDHLYNNQGRLQEKIPRLVGGGASEIGLGLQTAYEMLADEGGDNNYVIVLTNGAVAPNIQQEAQLAVQNLNSRGVQVFTYGVGRDELNINQEFLKTLATAGDGLYEGPVYSTQATTPSRISIKWGDPEQKEFGDDFSLIPFSLTHFITRDLELTATLNGHNQVSPKSAARVLVTTDFGQPALTTMNYGNGRVAALTVFSGSGLGGLVQAPDSRMLTRTVNWAIGDPQRKQDVYVDLDDARVGQETTATIRTDETINVEGAQLSKDGDEYTARFTPENVGFAQFFGTTYATNYQREYQRVGMNPSLNATLEVTEGKVFSPDEIDAIIEHVSELSRRHVVEREPLRWPFVALAVILFLIEALIRRLKS